MPPTTTRLCGNHCTTRSHTQGDGAIDTDDDPVVAARKTVLRPSKLLSPEKGWGAILSPQIRDWHVFENVGDLEIQRAEDAKWGRTQSKPIVRLDSQLHFPQFSPPSVADWDPLVSTETDGDIEYSMQQEMKQEARNQGPSFAQVITFTLSFLLIR